MMSRNRVIIGEGVGEVGDFVDGRVSVMVRIEIGASGGGQVGGIEFDAMRVDAMKSKFGIIIAESEEFIDIEEVHAFIISSGSIDVKD